MVENLSRSIESNQSGLHERLTETVRKHIQSEFLRPVADHSKRVFDNIQKEMSSKNSPLIIDACCGVGDSTRHFAKSFPDHFVIGLDKSESRLARERQDGPMENIMLVRTDLNDFYRLAAAADIRPERHYILYPNPWPKAAHLKRRWHGSPVFPSIVRMGGMLELRSNWDVYLKEFQQALKLVGKHADLLEFEAVNPITPFEAKYKRSHQMLWRLTCSL